jgi:hypothetical protein
MFLIKKFPCIIIQPDEIGGHFFDPAANTLSTWKGSPRELRPSFPASLSFNQV